MSYKIHFFLLKLFISTSIYSQHHYSNRQIDSSLNAIDHLVIEEPKKGLLVSNELYKLSVRNKYELGQAFSLIRIAEGEYCSGNYVKAIKLANKSNELARKINNDSIMLYSDFIIAVQYGNMRLNEKALHLLDDCESRAHFLEKNSRSTFLGRLYSFKAFFAKGLPKPVSTEQIIMLHKKAAHYFKGYKKNDLSAIYHNIAESYLQLKALDSAECYYQKAIAENTRLNNPRNYISMSELAITYHLKGNLKMAKHYLDLSHNDALKERHFEVLKANFGLYKKLYEKQGKFDLVLKYQTLESNYKDSIAANLENHMVKSTNYLEMTNDQKIKHLLSSKSKIFYGGILIVVIVFGFTCYQIFIKKRIKKDALLKEVEIINNKEEIRKKDFQITNLKQKVTTSYEEVIEMAKKDDPLFVIFFKELYPEFYEKLMHVQPDLTITEQKVCFYLKLKFSTKEIADYTFVTPKAIQNRKNRLRKRLYLNEGDDLYSWIDNL